VKAPAIKPEPAKAPAPAPKPAPVKAAPVTPPKPEPATPPPPAKVAGLALELDPGPSGAVHVPAPGRSLTVKRVRPLDMPLELELDAAGATAMALELDVPVAPGPVAPEPVAPELELELISEVHAPQPSVPPIEVAPTIEPPPPMPALSRTESVDLDSLPGEPTQVTMMVLPADETAPLADGPTAITSLVVPAPDDDDAAGQETTSVRAMHPAVAPGTAAAPAPAKAPTRPTPLPDDRPRIGRYLVFNEVSSGPSGTVFRGYDDRQKRDVGIEALSPTLDAFARRSLVTSLVKLDHPNVMRVHELIVHSGKPYLITEPLVGASLAQHVLEGGVYPWLEAVGLMDVVCAGLEYAHEHAVLHRAIRPHVIVLQAKSAKLRGFATAPDLADAAYVAPEVLAGGPFDRRSEIFAIGATLFFSLTGHAPGADHVLPNVPLKLQQLVDRMLAKQPIDRPTSVTEVRASFKGLLDF
jgi:hypothetical protein